MPSRMADIHPVTRAHVDMLCISCAGYTSPRAWRTRTPRMADSHTGLRAWRTHTPPSAHAGKLHCSANMPYLRVTRRRMGLELRNEFRLTHNLPKQDMFF
ncbi:hypothetical protein HanIR_Chr14g0683341 [Helianthus annuus]|nr:hypothetical protein HanIR_Chr14g0683341 [Helianthus annuus]